MTITQTDNLDEVLLSLQSRKEKLREAITLRNEIIAMEKELLLGSYVGSVIAVILDDVCAAFNINLGNIMSDSHMEDTTRPRQVAFYVARQLTRFSYPQIGSAFKKDHGTVMHGCRRVRDLMDTDARFRRTVEEIKAKCEERLKV